MSDSYAGGPDGPHVEHLPDGEALRRLAHEIIDRLPIVGVKAAVIALQEIEVSAQMHNRHEAHESGGASADS